MNKIRLRKIISSTVLLFIINRWEPGLGDKYYIIEEDTCGNRIEAQTCESSVADIWNRRHSFCFKTEEDAAIFLAYLKDEQIQPSLKKLIEEIHKEIEKNGRKTSYGTLVGWILRKIRCTRSKVRRLFTFY